MSERQGEGRGVVTAEALKRLDYWRGVVERDRNAWAPERERMDWREELFSGTKKFKPTCKAEEKIKDQLYCYHVRNVIAENIESMVDSRVPRPKVTALRKEDESLARCLEELLTSYMKRYHMKVINDQAERMGPIQGGLFLMAEWDDTLRTPDGPGDVAVSLLHPKQIIPQAGIYTGVEDMDHICVVLTMTVLQVLRRFGVDVSDLFEEDPASRGQDEGTGTEDDLVTVYVLFYRNARGGIGQIAWAGDVCLCDREDFQARRLRRCKSCGAIASYTQKLSPELEEELEISGLKDEGPERCLWCEGTEFEEAEVDEEEIMLPKVVMTNDGKEIKLPGAKVWFDERGRIRYEARATVKYYRPNLFPVVLQKNISKFGQLLGESDVDKMEDAQNLLKRLDKKMIDRTVKAGTKILLPQDVNLEMDTEDNRVIRMNNPADAQMIQTREFTGDLSQIMNLESLAYEQARQASGITDSMQGRRDPTATSAKAKEFSASKSEGRMESRRVMKQEAWAKLFELIAKLYLSCADEGRRIRVETATGQVEYKEFNRDMFLKQDKEGNNYYEDGFVFSVDDATSIGESREAMWQEINSSFSAGTLGNPQEISTLILYWGLMEEQSYPGAGQVKKKLEELQEQQAQQAKNTPPEQTPTVPGQGMPGGGMPGQEMAMQGGGMPG